MVDYGGETLDTSFHAVVDGTSDIPPNAERLVNYRLTRRDYDEVMERFRLGRCFVRLRVRYLNADGDTVEADRPLIAIGPEDGVTFFGYGTSTLSFVMPQRRTRE